MLVVAALVALSIHTARAAPKARRFWTKAELRRIDEGLAVINATRADLRFEKQPIDDPFRLDVVRRALDDPLSVGHTASEWDRIARKGDASDLVAWARQYALDAPPPRHPPNVPEDFDWPAAIPKDVADSAGNVLALATGIANSEQTPRTDEFRAVLRKAFLSQVEKPTRAIAAPDLEDAAFLTRIQKIDRAWLHADTAELVRCGCRPGAHAPRDPAKARARFASAHPDAGRRGGHPWQRGRQASCRRGRCTGHRPRRQRHLPAGCIRQPAGEPRRPGRHRSWRRRSVRGRKPTSRVAVRSAAWRFTGTEEATTCTRWVTAPSAPASSGPAYWSTRAATTSSAPRTSAKAPARSASACCSRRAATTCTTPICSGRDSHRPGAAACWRTSAATTPTTQAASTFTRRCSATASSRCRKASPSACGRALPAASACSWTCRATTATSPTSTRRARRTGTRSACSSTTTDTTPTWRGSIRAGRAFTSRRGCCSTAPATTRITA